MIRFEINQTHLPAASRLSKSWTRRLLRAIEKRLRLRGIHTLSIAFVDHRTMRRLNRTYRKKDRVTDILSFGKTPSPLRGDGWGGGGKNLGELILAWPQVREQAIEKGKSLREELALLLIHGVLHLRGYDHEQRTDAAKMLPLQHGILKSFLKS